ncbi:MULTISPECIES: 6-bladed beta-propeller [Bacteria]|jgi:hypothetical protein|nr:MULTISPECIES: 6-bladed beta-propeller [Bacteroidales]
MKNILFVAFVVALLFCGCSNHLNIDKYQQHSGNVIDVKDLVKEIVIDTPLIGGFARPYILGEYLILTDPQSEENQISIFDKKDFSYIAGTGHMGEGPNEITRLGEIILNEKRRRFYVADYGKMKTLEYELDSVLLNPNYLPIHKTEINRIATPVMFSFFNDTLCYACSMTAEPGKHFQESLVTWNMETGDMDLLITGHPKIERQRIRYAVSLEHNLIAVSYDHHDLLVTYDLQGNLKHNVYGPNWNDATSNAMIYYYGSIVICNNRIVVGYSGERNPEMGQIHVRNLLVYDLEGNYIKTLKIGYNILLFCYDAECNRLIMVLDDEIQFAYLDLEDLV